MSAVPDRQPGPPPLLRHGPLRPGAFTSPLHQRYLAARLGRALGWAFLVCFLTGLYSHLVQQPPSWFHNPARPVWLYRVTQGAHVATGLACIPLLLAKLWTVYPRLWQWPPVRGLAHAVERLSLLVLVGGAVFQLATGLANVFHWYFFAFFFTPTHYFTAWLTMGALAVHVGTKLAVAREALGQPGPLPAGDSPAADSPAADSSAADSSADSPVRDGPAPDSPAPDSPPGHVPGGLSRRGFLGTVAATAGAVTLVTVGESASPLGAVDLLGPRKPGTGPDHLPVNVTAREAGVGGLLGDPGYRLEVRGAGRTVSLSLADLAALPQRTVRLPITCVEGWSADARWTGVRVRDLLDLVGAPPGAAVRVESLQQHSLYRSAVLDAAHARDRLTLLATAINGRVLPPDHGYPARLIAPNQPGVLQTKWVHQLVVLG